MENSSLVITNSKITTVAFQIPTPPTQLPSRPSPSPHSRTLPQLKIPHPNLHSFQIGSKTINPALLFSISWVPPPLLGV